MADAHLVLDRLSARNRGRIVLDGVSLTLARGETLALLGPQGAGKTAILMLIAGFLRPTLGTVRLAGRDITMAPPDRRDVAMAFQDDALFPHLSVLENVAFGLKMRGVAREERRRLAGDALAALGIAALAERQPARLDAGQRRLVALARAAAARPALLLVDEPSHPENATEREAVRAVLSATLTPQHATAILATHDRAAAFGIADRVALLRDGRMEQIGTPPALYEEPANRFVASFTGSCNLLPATLLRQADGRATVALPHGNGQARCPPRLQPGPVLLCLRPHLARLDPAGPVRGIVSAVAYHGAVTRVTVEADGQTIVAEVAQSPAGIARGAEARIGWAASDAWLLPVTP